MEIVHDEKRTYLRHPVQEDITYSCGETVSRGKMLDISEGGIKFETEDLMPPMSHVTVTLHGRETMSLNGISIWASRIDATNITAIMFKDLNLIQEAFLESFIRQFSSTE